MIKTIEEKWSRKPLLIFPILILCSLLYWYFINRHNFKDASADVKSSLAKVGWREKCFFENYWLASNRTNSSTANADYLISKQRLGDQGGIFLFKANPENCQVSDLQVQLPTIDGGTPTSKFVFSSENSYRGKLFFIDNPKEIFQLEFPPELHLGVGENPDFPQISDDGSEILWRKPNTARYVFQPVKSGQVEVVDFTNILPKQNAVISFNRNEIMVASENSIGSLKHDGSYLWGPIPILGISPIYGYPNIKIIGVIQPPQIISWSLYSDAPISSYQNGKNTKISLERPYQVASTAVSPDGKLIAVVGEPENHRDTLLLLYDLQTGQNIYQVKLGGYARPGIAFWQHDLFAVSLGGGRAGRSGTLLFELVKK